MPVAASWVTNGKRDAPKTQHGGQRRTSRLVRLRKTGTLRGGHALAWLRNIAWRRVAA